MEVRENKLDKQVGNRILKNFALEKLTLPKLYVA